MRKALCVAVLLVLAWTTVAGAQGGVFRGLQWGDPPSALGDGLPVPTLDLGLPGLQGWVKANEDLSLGGTVRVRAILYSFLNDGLAMITITAEQFGTLSSIARARFGAPRATDPSTGEEVYVVPGTMCIVMRGADSAGMVLLSPEIATIVLQRSAATTEAAAEEFH